MNLSLSQPYPHTPSSVYMQTGQLAKGSLQENPGSVLKPVDEAKETAATRDTYRNTSSPASSRDASASNQEQKDPLEDSVTQQTKQNAKQSSEETRQEEKRQTEKALETRQLQLDQQQIQQLSARDREVRSHERAHAAVGGQYAGAPRYQYERGPDGVNYATAGEVSISTSAVNGDPQATMEKAQVIRRAALAPAEPSPQDRRVAAQATQMEAQARAELAETLRQERIQETKESEDDTKAEKITASDEEKEKSITEATEHKEPMFDLSEQNDALQRLTNDLGRRIVSDNIASQAPRPGMIVSTIA